MDGVSGSGGGSGIGGILKELIDSPMAPHNKIKDKKGGGGGKKSGGDKKGGAGGIGDIAGGLLGGVLTG